MTPDILCERDGPIATVTLFNPDKLNAVSAAMWQRLKSLMDELAGADVRVETLETARRIASGAPLIARMHKQWVRRLTATARGLSADELRDNFAFLDSTDYQEDLAAFFAKRPPRCTGA